MNLILIVFLPLLSSLICGLFGSKLPQKIIGFFASFILLISSLLSINLFLGSISNNYVAHIRLLEWISVGSLKIGWAIYADHLTLLMYAVVCIVSTVVHIYSIGYMQDDERFSLFFSYLSLFTFFMLMLVSADNLVQMFFGWEGVGLCSYLLIGFWYTKDSAAVAAKKAFIVNRIADVALMIGILIIYHQYSSFDFADVKAHQTLLTKIPIEFVGLKFSLLDLTCLLIFIGCMGKSAQIGLHVWLPDAMEGPTPVSALIHAATMVTAGVFLVARLHFLFSQSHSISLLITVIGALTCFMAALIAILQTDIKKIIAYSTCSQLGYMFIACGTKAYHIAIFHLATHAFYKATLFLSAGNIIHGTGYQELEKIGNVKAKMKITFLLFLVSSAAIMGVPPFAGFYSKDLILEHAYSNNNLAFVLGVLTAFYTGFYSTKILRNIFTTQDANLNERAHEASMVMIMPMLVLLFGSIFAGYFGMHFMHISEYKGYLKELFVIDLGAHNQGDHEVPMYVKIAPLIVSLLGGIFGYIYPKITEQKSLLLRLVKNKFYFDEMYECLIVGTIKNIALISTLFDTYVVDKLGPKNIVSLVGYLSGKVSKYHTGYIFTYGFYILLSLLCITIYFVTNF
jgi:NADH-quinone oxidoreductase subunit L